MAAKKSARKSPSKSKASSKSAKSSKKKTGKAGKTASADDSEPEKADTAAKGKHSSQEVNMGHIFALRPRATTSFKPGDFSTAKHQLREESYPDMKEAARAVAEKALELTHGITNRGRGQRF